MGLVLKQIKPKAFNSKAFETEFEKRMGKVGEQIRRDFEKTTATWKKKPKFEVLLSAKGGAVEILVDTDDKIFGYVELGTRPHVILPRKAKALKFKSKFSPKTSPGFIGSRAGGSSGSDVFSKGVLHPGTKPRNFSKTIKKMREPWFKREMETAINTAAKRSGHAL
jgi:hypothetical protein